MSNDYTKHVFTHKGVSIFKKAEPAKFDHSKAIIGKDHKDYSLLQFAMTKVKETKDALTEYQTELGWKPLSNAEKDALSKGDKRKHTLMSKKIDDSSQMAAYIDARGDLSNIWNSIKEDFVKATTSGVNTEAELVSILLTYGFVDEGNGCYIYKVSENQGFMAVIRSPYDLPFTNVIHFYESEYRQFTDKETNETKWHWTQGSSKASVVFEGLWQHDVQFKMYNFYASTSDEIVHITTLVQVAKECFNAIKAIEDKVDLYNDVHRTYEYELAS
jgi:hypothetical protein